MCEVCVCVWVGGDGGRGEGHEKERRGVEVRGKGEGWKYGEFRVMLFLAFSVDATDTAVCVGVRRKV